MNNKRTTMSEKKKIAIIGTVGVPANYGGFETLAEHLIRNLGNDYDFTVYCSGKKYSKNSRKRKYLGSRLVYLPFNANGISSIIYDTVSIIHALFFSEVLLILGVPGAWILPFVRLMTNKKIIISIDGIEWKREKWSFMAKLYLFWAEKLAVKYSHIDISDNESIQDYTALRYGSLSRIIEYGADHTLSVTPEVSDRKEFPFIIKPYAFKVCRIEPENNVHLVLKAFAELPKYNLVIVGNWNNSEYGINLRKEYGSFKNIRLLDPIYNQRKLDLLRGNAILYIHGHSAGGTNPSLVEAMYLGLPISTFGVSYNRTTTEGKALYFRTSDELKSIIESTSLPVLKSVGKTMNLIAKRRYIWPLIAEKYKALVIEALTVERKTSAIPETIKIDTAKLIGLDLGHLKHQQIFFEKR